MGLASRVWTAPALGAAAALEGPCEGAAVGGRGAVSSTAASRPAARRHDCPRQPYGGSAISAGAALALALSTWLVGCSEGEPECPAWFDPILPDYKPDFNEIDRAAGCRDSWSFFFGKPCASDVPILMTKKGLDWSNDENFVLGNVRNTLGRCLSSPPNGSVFDPEPCGRWTTEQFGCAQDTFEECKCTKFGDGFCSEWFCVSTEVHHQTCWEAEWDESWSADCDIPGSFPLIVNRTTFHKLLEADGVHMAFIGDYDAALAAMSSSGRRRGGAFGSFDSFGTECFVNRVVEESSQMPKNSGCSNGWRIVRMHLHKCSCGRARADGKACESWACEGQVRDGEEDERLENRRYVCTEAEPSKGYKQFGPGVQCGSWHGEEQSWHTAEIIECRACSNSTDCGTWGCSSYGAPRIENLRWDGDDDSWGHRFGFSLLHCLWLWPIWCCLILPTVVAAHSQDSWGGLLCVGACSIIPWAVGAFLVYAIAFLRWRDIHRPYVRNGWEAPSSAVWGLFVQCLVCWGLCMLTAGRCWNQFQEANKKGTSTSASCLSWNFMVVLSMIYTTGFFGALIFLLSGAVSLYVFLKVKLAGMHGDTEPKASVKASEGRRGSTEMEATEVFRSAFPPTSSTF